MTTVTFNEVEGGSMEAYKPYYIVVVSGGATISGQGGSVTLHQTSGSTSITDASYQFNGSTATIPNTTLYDAEHPAYILQSDGWWHKVPQNQPRAYVGPFRAYFQGTGSNNVKSLAMMLGGSYNPDEGNTPTDIQQILTVDSDGTERYFDLDGRLLPEKPQRGVYIVNGKKYINK